MLPLVLVPYVRSDPQIGAVLALVFLIRPAVGLGAVAHMAGHRRVRRRTSTVDPAAAAAASTTDITNPELVG